MKKIFNMSRSKSMESLVSNSKHFKFNPKINREPVEIYENRCNMTKLGRKSNNTSSLGTPKLPALGTLIV